MKNIINIFKAVFFDIKKNNKKAINQYKKSSLNINIILYRIAINYIKLKNWKEAEIYLRKIINNGIKKDIIFYRLGYSLEKQGYKQEAALFFKNAILLRPGYLPWIEHYFICSTETNIEEFTDNFILLGTKRADAWHALAEQRIKKFSYYQAIPALENALKYNSLKGKWWEELGQCQEKLGQNIKAEYAYNKAIKLGIRSENIYYRLGLVQESLGKKNESFNSYKIACEIGGKNNKYGGAMLHKEHGDWEKVIYSMEEYISKFPLEDATSYYILGMAYDYCYKFEKACEIMEIAISLEGGNKSEWICRLAMLYERRGNLNRAKELYLKSNKLKKNKDVLFLLGRCFEKLYEYKKACEVYIESFDGVNIIDYTINEINERVKHNIFDPYVSWQYGKTLYNNRKYKEACLEFHKIKKMFPCMPYGLSKKIFDENLYFRLKAIYLDTINHERVNEKIIFYESYLGNTMSCNPYALFIKIKHNEDFSEFIHVWSINDIETVPPEYRDDKKIIFVKRGTIAYIKYLATAKYLINNVTFPSYFIRRAEQIYCNTWHGTPLKCLGDKNKYAIYDYSNVTRNFLHATWLIQPNNYTNEKILDDYHIKNIISGQSVITGYPRQDLLLNISEEKKISIRHLLGEYENKKILLYAPTWRDYESEDIQEKRISNVLNIIKKFDYHVVFKGHQFLEKKFRNLNITRPPRWLDTNELLSVTDILITDYSSIGIDFLVTKRPIIYYIEDLEEYIKGRGLYLSKDRFPGIICNNSNELYEILSKQLFKVSIETWTQKLTIYDDGYASNRVIDLIFNKKPIKTKNYKPTILFYGGTLLSNGIWTAMVNLVNCIIENLDIYLIVDAQNLKDINKINLLSQLSKKIHILPYKDDDIQSIEESFCLQKWNIYNKFIDKRFEQVIINYYRREYLRIFGETKFNAIINFEGYNSKISSILAACNNVSKKIIYCHNSMIEEYRERFPYLHKIFELYRYYSCILSVSIATGKLNRLNLSNKFNIPSDKFNWIDNLLNYKLIKNKACESLNDFELNYFKTHPIFINVGRLSIEKDHSKLIKAFKYVVENYPSAKLLILGEGFLKLNLIQLIQELNIQNNVFLLGQKENPYPWINKADCFVLSSNHEGQPMVLLEAIALQKPIIATDIVATRGMLHNTDAKLVNNSEKDLANAMISACKSMPKPIEFDFENYNKQCLTKLYNIISC